MATESAAGRRAPSTRLLLTSGLLIAAALVVLVVLGLGGGAASASGQANLLVLAIPSFLAGVLSFLSPCTLPILPAYFAFTFQQRRQNILLTTVAFVLGLATTMTVLGASATALSAAVFNNKNSLTFWGGIVVILLGAMSFLGKGFSGPQIGERPAAGVIGSYLYGATFALGWTACIGPILAALYTLLASNGLAIVQGAVLAFVYALGLGVPLVLVATFFSRLGSGSRVWSLLRGKGFDVPLGFTTLYLHSNSMLAGALMIAMGVLLATGQLSQLTQYAQASPLAQWVTDIERAITSTFGLQ
jgi:cytochrome c-type biogenesis protein